MKGKWVELRPGIFRKPLAKNQDRGIQIDYMRIAPNMTDMAHTHDDFEWVYVIKGSFQDQAGIHRKGDFVVNSTEGVHQVSTGDEGCLLIIVWVGSVTNV